MQLRRNATRLLKIDCTRVYRSPDRSIERQAIRFEDLTIVEHARYRKIMPVHLDLVPRRLENRLAKARHASKERKDPGRGTHERAHGAELLRNVLGLSESVGLGFVSSPGRRSWGQRPVAIYRRSPRERSMGLTAGKLLMGKLHGADIVTAHGPTHVNARLASSNTRRTPPPRGERLPLVFILSSLAMSHLPYHEKLTASTAPLAVVSLRAVFANCDAFRSFILLLYY